MDFSRDAAPSSAAETLSPSGLHESGKRLMRVNLASEAPLQKLADIDSTARGLGLEHPRLRFCDLLCEAPLSQASRLPHLSQQRRHSSVDDRELTLGHGGPLSGQNCL